MPAQMTYLSLTVDHHPSEIGGYDEHTPTGIVENEISHREETRHRLKIILAEIRQLRTVVPLYRHVQFLFASAVLGHVVHTCPDVY